FPPELYIMTTSQGYLLLDEDITEETRYSHQTSDGTTAGTSKHFIWNPFQRMQFTESRGTNATVGQLVDSLYEFRTSNYTVDNNVDIVEGKIFLHIGSINLTADLMPCAANHGII